MKRWLLLLLITASAQGQMPGPMPEGRWVVAGGHRLNYYREGHGPIVLFLHGFGGNGTNWSAQFPALRSRFTVIALDQLGFGKSSKPQIEYDSDLLAESTVRFLDALHIRRVTVVGASMGGHVAARIAAKHPERVDHLVLMDSSGESEPSDPSSQLPSDPKSAEDQRKILEVLFYDQALVTPQLIEQRLTAHLTSNDSYTRQHFRSPSSPLRPMLSKVVAPTLLIWGEHDRLVPLVAACRFRTDIAQSKLVVVANAAHVPQMEQAEVFNSTLIRFLTGEKADDDCARFCNCAMPQSFRGELVAPGVISTPAPESGGAFTPDGKEFYFTIRTLTTTSTPVAAICVSRFRNGRWQKPEVTSFSGRGLDYAPSISPDGKIMIFTSSRPVNGEQRYDTDLWRVDREGDGWGEPRRLPAPINSDANEQSSSIAPDGSLYFSSDRSGGKGSLDLYRAPGVGEGWGEIEPVAAVNSPYTDTHPFVTRDGKLLFFVSSGRPEDAIAGGAPYPRGDIYYCVATDGGWSTPRRFSAAVNTPASETYPVVSPDGEWLYFTSEVSFAIIPLAKPISIIEAGSRRDSLWNGGGNIYRIRLRDHISAADR